MKGDSPGLAVEAAEGVHNPADSPGVDGVPLDVPPDVGGCWRLGGILLALSAELPIQPADEACADGLRIEPRAAEVLFRGASPGCRLRRERPGRSNVLSKGRMDGEPVLAPAGCM